MEQLIVLLLLLAIGIYVFRVIDPKIDWNYETGEKLLWYNDPFDSCKRKVVTIGIAKN